MTLRKTGLFLLYGCVGAAGLVVLLSLALGLALDRTPAYQADIKELLHRRVGYPVEFARASVAFRWRGPELYFEHLELRSKDGRRVLARADAARVGLDPGQFVHGGRLFAPRIELDGPVLDVTRVDRQRFTVGTDIELGAGDSPMATWSLDALPAGSVAVRHGKLTLLQWNAALPRLELDELSLDARHAGTELTVAAAAHLPAALGGRLGARGAFRGHGGPNTLGWTVTGDARDLTFPGWRALLPDYLQPLQAGGGGGRFAVRGQGTDLLRAELDFGVAGLVTQLPDGASSQIRQLSGLVTLAHVGARWTLLGRRVRSVRPEGTDPESQFDASWRATPTGVLDMHASASYLRVDSLLPLAGLLPQHELRRRLQDLAPTGEWFDTRLDMNRTEAAQPWRFTVQARFRELGFAPVGRLPGLRGLTGAVSGDDSGGRIDLASPAPIYAWPAQFSQPVELQSLKTTLYWKRDAEQMVVATPAVEFKTHDASLHGRFAWRQPFNGDSPVMTLAATVDDGNVARAHAYLPRGLISPPALAWLNRAFVAGRMPHADVVIQGPIRHFPFRDGSGTFLARCRIEKLTLDYREHWPRAEEAALVAEFRNEGLTVQIDSGRVGPVSVTHGSARFADFKTGELQIQINTRGDAQDALAYLRATPLDALAEHAFSNVEAHGPVESTVDLFFPFKEFERRRVQVHVQLDGLSMKRPGSALSATDLQGDADLDNGQVARADVRGKLLGGSFQMLARAPRNRPVTRTQLEFRGVLSGASLHDALALPARVPIGGQTDWRAILKLSPAPARERSLRITSSLAGFELNLPEPLAKPAGRPLPTSVDVQWPAAGPTQLRVTLGSVLRSAFSLDFDQDGPHLGHAALAFGDSAQQVVNDAQKVNTGGKIDRFDLAGWLKLYTPDPGAKPVANYVSAAKFEVSQLDYLGLSFLHLSLDLAVKDGNWRIGVGGPDVVGTLALPLADVGAAWTLEFERLKFVDGPDQGAVPDVGKGVSDAQNGAPHGIPAINFHAAQMLWGDRQFGDVRATLAKAVDGITLHSLQVKSPSFAVDAQGEWRGKDAGLGSLKGSISSDDVGGAFKQLGYSELIEARTGKVDFDLSWTGAPTAAALSESRGRVDVALDKGQIAGIDPGAGRFLGLASLAALPRHLALDFSDLTDKGLAFDTVRGHFAVRDGDAHADDVVLKGPAVEISLSGRVGLKNRDYDQTAVVTARDTALPLAAFAGGPVVGAAVLVFTQVFKEPLEGLARGYYRITGAWSSPTVQRIKSSDAAGTTAEAPK